MSYKKFAVNKLIRDNMPEILRKRSINLEWHLLSPQEHIQALKSKLIEEAHEVLESANTEEFLEELSDLQEVIDALLKIHNASKDIMHDIQTKKRIVRGGFEQGIYSTTISMAEDNPFIEYYLAKPKEYPEI